MVNEAQRLFFALWPDDALRAAMVAATDTACSALRGRRMPAQNLHATLAFIGAVDPQQRDCLESAADAVVAQPFDLVLDRLGYFARPQVLWLAPREPCDAYAQLVEELQRRLAPCGYRADRRAFVPHITLMRKVRRAPPQRDIDPLHWRVENFALVRSQTLPEGARYEVLRHWSLGRPSATH